MSESTGISQLLRGLPAVDQLLERDDFRSLQKKFSRSLVRQHLREKLEKLRDLVRSGSLAQDGLEVEIVQLGSGVEASILDDLSPSLRPVINATGVVLYTNAGRAPLGAEAAREMFQVATQYNNLEYDLQAGGRGHRDQHFEQRMKRLTGCQAATVCNNTAAALLLILNTLSEGRETLVSRGELIEIGGSFRIPAIMKKSGAILREVGTTNKTRASDYEEAIDPSTALLLRVHPSNYQIVGFTERPELDALAAVAHRHQLPLVYDIGSGCLSDEAASFLESEPSATACLKAGADLICFSGDKLMGGPQAGLILGRKDLVDAIRKNPLMRACRVDKMTYSALEWTLLEYEKGTYRLSLPTWRFLLASLDSLRTRAVNLSRKLKGMSYKVEITRGNSLTGGGSAPQQEIPTVLLAIESDRLSPDFLAERLRLCDPPLLGRIDAGRFILDLRTVFEDQDQIIARLFQEAAKLD